MIYCIENQDTQANTCANVDGIRAGIRRKHTNYRHANSLLDTVSSLGYISTQL